MAVMRLSPALNAPFLRLTQHRWQERIFLNMDWIPLYIRANMGYHISTDRGDAMNAYQILDALVDRKSVV